MNTMPSAVPIVNRRAITPQPFNEIENQGDRTAADAR
jgi:hypothetical protein